MRTLSLFRSASSAAQMRAVCTAMVHSLGGTDGLMAAWRSCLHKDLAKGGMAALRHLEAVARLIQHCEAARPDYSRLSDRQLEIMAGALSKPPGV